MREKRGVMIGSCVFFAGMLFLTFSSRAIHEAMLVHVQTVDLKMQMFDISETRSDGTEVTSRSKYYALPAELAKQEEIYVVVIWEKNEEERTFAQRAFWEFGEEQGGVYPIVSGYNGEEIIVETTGSVADGAEVIVEPDE